MFAIHENYNEYEHFGFTRNYLPFFLSEPISTHDLREGSTLPSR